MQLSTSARDAFALAVVLSAALAFQGCDKSPPPPPADPAPIPGATVVRGTEHLAWNQAGDTADLRFTAYVDALAVALTAATCDAATPEATCTSPLPPLANGPHTIALSAVSTSSGLESTQTDPITVQKVSATAAAGIASFPDAVGRSNAVRLESLVTSVGGLAFSAEVVARDVQAPAQLTSLPDGRLIVAEANGRVRVIHPGLRDRDETALGARTLRSTGAIGPLGLAGHPDFARNHFVYVSFLTEESPGRRLLRVVRLREVGDALGEPASLFETPVVTTTPAAQGPPDQPALTTGGPRLAFGPDGLLYVALPAGVEFDREPAASSPQPSMIRLTDDGRIAAAGPLSGITAHPLGFGWHSSTGALWVILPGEQDEAVLRRITPVRRPALIAPGQNRLPLRDPFSDNDTSGIATVARVGLQVSRGYSPASRDLIFRGIEAGGFELARAFASAPGIVRLTMPILAQGLAAGADDRIGDVVVGDGGTLFLATSNAALAGGTGTTGGDVVMRLTPRIR